MIEMFKNKINLKQVGALESKPFKKRESDGDERARKKAGS